MYRDAACKPWTSRRWAPPGFASRKDVEAQPGSRRDQTRKDDGVLGGGASWSGAQAGADADTAVGGGGRRTNSYEERGRGFGPGANEKNLNVEPKANGDMRASEERRERVDPAVW